MIKLIVGTKGSGKTKTLVDMINSATKTTSGNVVVIEKGMTLTFDVDHAARLIDLEEYKISGYQAMYGFVAGVLASNYDITELFIDGIMRVGGSDLEALGTTLDQIAALAGDKTVTLTISASEASLPDSVKKYL